MTIRERIRAKAWSLAGELILWLLISGIAAGTVFGIFNMAVTRWIDNYVLEDPYLEKAELKMVQELQDYVLEQDIVASDQRALSGWVKKKSIVYLEIYRNDMLLYVSDMTEAENYYEDMEVPYYRESYYDVRFADGKAEVFLVGAFAYRYQMYTVVASMVLCFLIFIGCFLWGVRRRILYIQDIHREVEIMEGGCLDHGIPVRGRDELARLAGGLNQMRLTLKENMEQEQELREANQDLIVGLAHDLRTPLTALTTYVQVMQSGVCGDELKRDYYLDKIMAKAVQMKELSDRLFECSQVGEEKGKEKAEEPMLFQSVFIDSLSEMAMFLGGQGLRCATGLKGRGNLLPARRLEWRMCGL